MSLLVDDGIDRDRGLTSLTVADDELTLTSSDRDHRVDSFDTGLKRGIYALTGNNAAGNSLNLTIFGCLDRAFAIDGLSESVNYSSKHCIAYGNFNNSSGSLNEIAFVDIPGVSKENYTDVIFLKV